jgi:ribonucleoside-triphosphate reductase
LAVIALESVQNEMHGGQAIPAFDFYMAPYVRATYIEEINKIKTLLSDNPDEQYWMELEN